MVKIREENINSASFWDSEHGDSAPQNKDITAQFERFFIWNYLPINEAVSVLDIGCGQAFHLRDLKNKYPQVRLIGLDISQVVYEKNTSLCQECEFIKKDITTEELDTTYDYIVSMHTFEHFEDPVAVLKKCIKHCKKDVIICVPYENAWGSDPSHVHKFILEDPFTGYKSYKLSETKEEIFFVFSGEANG